MMDKNLKNKKPIIGAIILGALIGTFIAFVFPLSHFFNKVKKQEVPMAINIQENVHENGTLTPQEKEIVVDFNATH